MGIGALGGLSVCTWYLCEANYSDIRPSWKDSFRKRVKREITQERELRQENPAATEGLLLAETTAVNIVREEVISSPVGEVQQGEGNTVNSAEDNDGHPKDNIGLNIEDNQEGPPPYSP